MKVLITGSKGQVGSDLLRRADRYPGMQFLGCDSSSLDITDAAGIRALFERERPALVINAAAYTAVDRAETEPARAFAVNAEGVRTLAATCRDTGAVLLHVSTDYVFDGNKDSAWQPDDATGPLGVYGQSKLAGEAALRDALPQHVILRTSWVFGEQGNNFVRTMLRVGSERDHLRVVADQVGGPTWSGHLADALLALAERYRTDGNLPWGTGHFAGQPFVSWHGLALAIFEEAARAGMIARQPAVEAITTDQYPTPARRPHNSRLDMAQTTARWGLAVPDWREGLRHVLATWKEQARP